MVRIAFESTDGAGKTTGLKYILEQIRARGLTAIETREVGNPNSPVCVKLREVVLDPANNMTGEGMEFVFAAMRVENEAWLNKLRKSDNKPNFILSDREFLSHVAYTDHNVSKWFSFKLYFDFMFDITSFPEYVIYFQVDTETALQRRIKRGEGMADAIEMKGVAFQEKVRHSFEEYIASFKNEPRVKIFTVDANQSLENVKQQLDVILNTICESIKA